MSLVFLTFCLLSAPPAQAQGPGGSGDGPPQDPGHYWQVTYASSGTAAMDYIYGNPNNILAWGPYPWTDTPGEAAGGGGAGGQYSVDATTSGSVATTLTWIPAAGQTLASDPPSEPVHILESGYAAWSLSGPPNPPPGGAASDGLGDPPVAPQYEVGQISSGKKIISKDGSSGTINLDPVTLSANTPAYPGYLQWGYATADAFICVSIDNRAVTISSDIEPTWKKGKVADRVGYPVQDQWGNDVYEPVQNTRDVDGTGHGDVGLAASPQSVLVPTPSDSYLYITYTANRIGDWHIPGLMDSWYSSLTSASASDTLIDPSAVSSFVVSYSRPSDPQVIGYDPYDGTPLYSQALPGKTGADHIHLTCQDAASSSGSGGDGASATANYYMNVHDEWENPFKSHSDPPFWKDVKIDDPAPVAHNGDNVPFTYTTDGASTDGNIIGDAGWTFLFNAAPGWLQGIMKVAGLDDNIKPTHTPGVTDFYGVWHTDGNGATWSNSSTRPDDSQMSNYRLNYRLQRRYLSTWVRADHYVMPGDASGYTGFAGQRDQHFTALDTKPAGTQGTGDFVLDIR